jgi:hypothetical protein
VTIHGHHSSEKIVEVIFAGRDVNIFANLKRAGEALDILIKSRQLHGAILKDNPLKIDLARAPQSIPTRNVMLAAPRLQAAARNGTVSGTSGSPQRNFYDHSCCCASSHFSTPLFLMYSRFGAIVQWCAICHS